MSQANMWIVNWRKMFIVPIPAMQVLTSSKRVMWTVRKIVTDTKSNTVYLLGPLISTAKEGKFVFTIAFRPFLKQ